MKYIRSWLCSTSIILVSGLLGACSGKLQVYDASGKEVSGIPFSTREVWVVQGFYTKLGKGGNCDPQTPFQKLTTLTTGPQYFLKPSPAIFSKTTFSAKLGEDGTLTEVAFNSESTATDAINATDSILKTVLPALGVAAAAAPPGATPACDTGEKLTKLTPLTEWLKAH